MGRRDESGAVTAETAVVLPLIVVFTLSMAWLAACNVWSRACSPERRLSSANDWAEETPARSDFVVVMSVVPQ